MQNFEFVRLVNQPPEFDFGRCRIQQDTGFSKMSDS